MSDNTNIHVLSPQEMDLISVLREIPFGRVRIYMNHSQPERIEEAFRSRKLKTTFDNEIIMADTTISSHRRH